MGISSGLTVTGQVPVGSVTAFAGSSAPAGWLLCGGQAVSRTEYAGLFAVVSTTYGSGDGSTTFNVPDMRGRVAAGKDDMGGSAASRLTSTVLTASNTLGATGGAQTHTLTSSEMPSHTHTQDSHNHTQNAHNHGVTDPTHTHAQVYNGAPSGAALDGSKISYGTVNDLAWRSVSISSSSTGISINNQTPTNNATTATNQNTGGGGAHSNTQPTIVLNYIIKAA